MLVLNTIVLGYHGIEFLLKHQLLSGSDGGTQWHKNRMIISNRDYVPSEVESGTGSGHNMIWLAALKNTYHDNYIYITYYNLIKIMTKNGDASFIAIT